MMQKEVGKVYHNDRTWVFCTGKGKSDNTFSGYVVEQLDPTSEHQFDYHSNNWTDSVFTKEMKSEPRIWYKSNPEKDGNYICKLNDSYIKPCHFEDGQWFDIWKSDIGGEVKEWTFIRNRKH